MTETITGQLLESPAPFDFKKAYELGQQQTQVIDINGVQLAIIPQGMKVEFLKEHFDEMLDKPRHFEQFTEVASAEDFIAYFNRYANEESSIFFTENGEFKAILDWHHSATEPSFKRHVLKFNHQPHRTWNEWLNKNNSKLSQEEFALFIEDHINEFEQPAGEEMLEIASTLKATIGVNFKQQKILSNGQSQIAYEENIDGRAGLEGQFFIPKEFTINLQPFKSSSAYRIKAWFRYRISKNDGLTMWYTLRNPVLSKEDAVKEAVETIKAGITTGHIYRA